MIEGVGTSLAVETCIACSLSAESNSELGVSKQLHLVAAAELATLGYDVWLVRKHSTTSQAGEIDHGRSRRIGRDIQPDRPSGFNNVTILVKNRFVTMGYLFW